MYKIVSHPQYIVEVETFRPKRLVLGKSVKNEDFLKIPITTEHCCNSKIQLQI